MLYRTCKTYEDKDNIIALTILRNCINDDVIEQGNNPGNYSFTVYVEKGVMVVIAEQKCPVCEGSGYDVEQSIAEKLQFAYENCTTIQEKAIFRVVMGIIGEEYPGIKDVVRYDG